MADAASIGASFSSYSGNPLLGGANITPVKIDTVPVQRLAAFSNIKNRFAWVQRRKDASELATQIAGIDGAFDLSKLYETDREKLRGDVNGVLGKISDLARKSTTDKIGRQIEMQELIRPVMEEYDSAKQRMADKKVRMAEIQTKYADNPALMKWQNELLDKEMRSTDVMTRVSPLTPWQPKSLAVPPPVMSTVGFSSTGGNIDVAGTASIFVPRANTGASDRMAIGLGATDYPKTIMQDGKEVPNPQYEVQKYAPMSEGSIWADSVRNFNEARAKYIKDGKFDETEFRANAGDVLVETLDKLESLDKYSRGKVGEVARGMYSYKGAGEDRQSLSADDFKAGIIDFDNPIPVRKLSMSELFSKRTPDIVKEKSDRHNTGLERQKLAETANAHRLAFIAKGGVYENGKPVLRKGAGGGINGTGGINKPVQLYAAQMNKVINHAATHPTNESNSNILMEESVTKTDRYTLKALGVNMSEENKDANKQKIRYLRSGDVEVIGADGEVLKTSSQESFAQGFISGVKGINKSGVLDSKWQEAAESSFGNLFGDATPTSFFSKALMEEQRRQDLRRMGKRSGDKGTPKAQSNKKEPKVIDLKELD